MAPPRKRRRARATPSAPRQVRGVVSPRFSPDGERIVFCALNALWLLEINDRRPRRLVGDGFPIVDPDWSPDGQSIVYTSDRAGNPDLWRYDLADGTSHRLTALPYAAVGAAWSHDGSRIAFGDQDGRTHVLNISTGQTRQVLTALWQPVALRGHGMVVCSRSRLCGPIPGATATARTRL